jgi:NADH dehydrogenase [ubiquinone] 1 alpha subcomplex assembly factor 7
MDAILMAEVMPLEIEIRRRIAAAGPMPVREYMALCLTDHAHGYYTTRDPLGARGDFITAPEISQMFGELIGLWMAAVWKQMNEPANLRIIELGPGRGTMMSDALRATKVMPAFRAAVVLHLIEISPALQAQQERTFEQLPVPMFWHPTLMDVPAGPAIIVANEFFDALPVNQAVKSDRGWHERRIGTDPEGTLAFTVAADPIPHFERLLPPAVREAPAASIFEWRSDTVAMEMGRRIARDGGAALVIDYGHAKSAVGETLQAVGQHAYADPLTAPGTIDLTAHVDFQALAQAVEAMGVKSFGPIEQSEFLRRLGIETRAETIKARAKAEGAHGSEVDAALARLTGRSRGGMGMLFKAAAYAHPTVGVPPGFES